MKKIHVFFDKYNPKNWYSVGAGKRACDLMDLAYSLGSENNHSIHLSNPKYFKLHNVDWLIECIK